MLDHINGDVTAIYDKYDICWMRSAPSWLRSPLSCAA